MNIEARNLTKYYGSQKAVDNISFSLNKGDILGFLGPNGAGKSTTLKMLTAYFSPTSGEVLMGDENIYDNLRSYKAKIGYLPENNPLYDDMYVVDFLRWNAAIQGFPKEKTNERLKQVLQFCGLEPEIYKRIGALSKGYKQRVGIAQAIIHDPEILILDEPTTGLDPIQVAEIRELIKNLGKEKAIIFSTHILSEVKEVCNRVIIINKGKIIIDKFKNELNASARPSLLVRIEAPATDTEILQALEQNAGVEKAYRGADSFFHIETADLQHGRKAVMQLCLEKNWNLLEMSEAGAQLEDIFRELTQSHQA